MISVFTTSVDKSQQGWVMGVSTALWTLGTGMTQSTTLGSRDRSCDSCSQGVS